MGHLRRDWHWNKEQNKGKYEKNNSEKNTTAAVIDEDVVVLYIEEQKCEHLSGNYCVLPEYHKCALPPLTLMVGPTN